MIHPSRLTEGENAFPQYDSTERLRSHGRTAPVSMLGKLPPPVPPPMVGFGSLFHAASQRYGEIPTRAPSRGFGSCQSGNTEAAAQFRQPVLVKTIASPLRSVLDARQEQFAINRGFVTLAIRSGQIGVVVAMAEEKAGSPTSRQQGRELTAEKGDQKDACLSG